MNIFDIIDDHYQHNSRRIGWSIQRANILPTSTIMENPINSSIFGLAIMPADTKNARIVASNDNKLRFDNTLQRRKKVRTCDKSPAKCSFVHQLCYPYEAITSPLSQGTCICCLPRPNRPRLSVAASRSRWLQSMQNSL